MSCPGCDDPHARSIVQLGAVPVHAHVLHRSAEAARAADRAELTLAACPKCGLLFNEAFDPARVAYDLEYDNALHGSRRFREYQRALAEDLVQRHELGNKSTVELGCGDGGFLRALRAAGAGPCIGFDPTAAPIDTDGVRIERGYGENAAGDFLVCRHVLEHIPDPIPFLRSIAVRSLYLEVPDARWTVDAGGIWDLLYEHCSYYTPWSLATVLQRAGFGVTRTTSAYGGQFLQAEARRDKQQTGLPAPELRTERRRDGDVRDVPEDWAERTAALSRAYEEAVDAWRARFAEWNGARVVLWGAGSKGVMLLNAVDGSSAVGRVVDVNPKKHGCFVAGTGHPIVPPDALVSWRPDVVVLLNSLYRKEVQATLQGLGVTAAVRA